MTLQKLNISIPKPCDEDWAEMTPKEKGRFCASCEKVVVDFTHMIDDELVKYFANYNGAIPCGRFREDQLGKNIIQMRQEKSFLSNPFVQKLAASFLLLQSLFYGVTSSAQSKASTEQVTTDQEKQPEKVVIKGRVVDYLFKKPLRNIRVSIKHTAYSAITDGNGYFSIQVTDNLRGELSLVGIYLDQQANVRGTTIWEERGTLEELLRRQVILYRYPEYLLSNTIVTGYRVPEIDAYASGGHKVLTGNPEVVSVSRRVEIDTLSMSLYKTKIREANFWYRITNIFRKNK